MQQIADKCLQEINKVLRREIKAETCPMKRAKAEWKKQEIKNLLAKMLVENKIGPNEFK
jgi:CO dehydrogenase/acetyl-CoA synthase gamma subunit (corrinoid Fe-S protein)